MRIQTETARYSVTLRCSGRLVLGLESEMLRCFAMSREELFLTLDLGGVQTVDAAGLGVLVELQRWAQRHNKQLKITSPSSSVRNLILLTGLQFVLGIADADLLPTDECGHASEMTA
jgi:anti-anti-sigma factor